MYHSHEGEYKLPIFFAMFGVLYQTAQYLIPHQAAFLKLLQFVSGFMPLFRSGRILALRVCLSIIGVCEPHRHSLQAQDSVTSLPLSCSWQWRPFKSFCLVFSLKIIFWAVSRIFKMKCLTLVRVNLGGMKNGVGRAWSPQSPCLLCKLYETL